MEVLYISYDGATDNLGQSQVIPYVNGLAKKDIAFSLLTFEKKQNQSLINPLRERLNRNINWVCLRYHKAPSLIVTLYDIIHGLFISLFIVKRRNIKIVHGRTFIGSIIAQYLKNIFKIKVILDFRGFWPEERVEAGIWKKNGLLYKITKRIERKLILNADEIVVLTQKCKGEIEKAGYFQNKNINITVIPTCSDLNNQVGRETRKYLSETLKLMDRFPIAYVGSISTWYLPSEMLNFFDILRKRINNSYFLILTKENKFLEGILQKDRQRRECISVLSVEHRMVSQYLSISRAGLAFYKPGHSRMACCPTKVGEYLAQGLPVIINRGIGDCDEIITQEKVGILINEFSVPEYERAVNELLDLSSEGESLSDRCRAAAKKYFSLERGVEKYLDIYTKLTDRR